MTMKHLTESDVARMKRGELAATEQLPVLQHIAMCAECRARVAGDARSLARFSTSLHAEAEPHLEFDTQIAPFVDGTVDVANREIVESHLDDCAMCRAEVADVRRLRDELAQRETRRRRMWIAATFAAAAASAAIVFSSMQRVPRVDSSPHRTPPAISSINTTPAIDPEWQALIETSLATSTLPLPRDLAALRPPAESPRGTTARVEVHVEPAGVVLEDTMPSFSWPTREHARFVVAVFDGETEVLRSPSLHETRWTATNPLKRGRTYAWQIEVTYEDGATEILPAPPAPPALFRITTDAAHAELTRAKAQHPNDHLLLAVLHARAGLEREARAELALIPSNDPRVAALRGRYPQTPP